MEERQWLSTAVFMKVMKTQETEGSNPCSQNMNLMKPRRVQEKPRVASVLEFKEDVGLEVYILELSTYGI